MTGQAKRVPPHDLDAERALIGAMMLSADAVGAASRLTVADFYDTGHGLVFAAIQALHGAGKSTEPVVVTDRLRADGVIDRVGGHQKVVDIMASAPNTSPTAVADYVEIIAAKARNRVLIEISTEVTKAAYNGGIEPGSPVAQALAEAAKLVTHTASDDVDVKAMPGGDWVLDQPAGIPAIWGSDQDVLWAAGESLIVAGPAGVGKTTLAGQLVWARLGLLDDVLGLPVTTTSSRVLYLAMDRPRQAQRALGRLAQPEHRDVLNRRLLVRPGPPPRDLARHPEIIAYLANATGSDTIVIDSLKDAAIGLADDETGAGLNRALQVALAEGVEVLALHHQRKGQNGTKPTKLEDLYGSTWIGAGAGSVLLLWGQPGDQLVELHHLKQPAATIGPLKVEHDHTAGRTTVETGFDVLRYLRAQPRGVDAEQAAAARYAHRPNENERRVVRRQLDRLVERGLARKVDAILGGPTGTQPARWYPVDTHHREPS